MSVPPVAFDDSNPYDCFLLATAIREAAFDAIDPKARGVVVNRSWDLDPRDEHYTVSGVGLLCRRVRIMGYGWVNYPCAIVSANGCLPVLCDLDEDLVTPKTVEAILRYVDSLSPGEPLEIGDGRIFPLGSFDGLALPATVLATGRPRACDWAGWRRRLRDAGATARECLRDRTLPARRIDAEAPPWQQTVRWIYLRDQAQRNPDAAARALRIQATAAIRPVLSALEELPGFLSYDIDVSPGADRSMASRISVVMDRESDVEPARQVMAKQLPDARVVYWRQLHPNGAFTINPTPSKDMTPLHSVSAEDGDKGTRDFWSHRGWMAAATNPALLIAPEGPRTSSGLSSYRDAALQLLVTVESRAGGSTVAQRATALAVLSRAQHALVEWIVHEVCEGGGGWLVSQARDIATMIETRLGRLLSRPHEEGESPSAGRLARLAQARPAPACSASLQ